MVYVEIECEVRTAERATRVIALREQHATYWHLYFLKGKINDTCTATNYWLCMREMSDLNHRRII
jgi:hypothetical protein